MTIQFYMPVGDDLYRHLSNGLAIRKMTDWKGGSVLPRSLGAAAQVMPCPFVCAGRDFLDNSVNGSRQEQTAMTVPMILAPVFIQVALTFALLIWMASVRTASVSSGETKVRDIALRQPAWPAKPNRSRRR